MTAVLDSVAAHNWADAIDAFATQQVMQAAISTTLDSSPAASSHAPQRPRRLL